MVQRLTYLLCLSLIACFISAQNLSGTIEHDGVTRDYILHLPDGYDAEVAYPFVYNLHGFGSNAAQQQFYSAMDGTADDNGFIVCYPNGLDASWNVGWDFGSTADDVDFLLKLVDSLAVDYNVDYDRLYSCGMSNGGFMSYKLACEASDRFAAIASVTGSMVPNELQVCDPTRKMPVMQIHGTADPTVEYNGTAIGAAIDDVVTFWAANNICNLSADTIQIEDINTADGCTAELIQYTDCVDSTEVLLYKIDGGAHTWPDAAITIGVTNRDFNASLEIWNFFSRFDLNGVVTANKETLEKGGSASLFPNPVSDQVTVSDLPIDAQSVKIIDAAGRIIYTQTVSEKGSVNINLLDQSSGLYYVIIETKSGNEILKFVKY